MLYSAIFPPESKYIICVGWREMPKGGIADTWDKALAHANGGSMTGSPIMLTWGWRMIIGVRDLFCFGPSGLRALSRN